MFADVLSITISDPDHSENQERWEAMSVSNRQRLLVVVHIDEEANPYHLDGNNRAGHAAMEVLLHGFENRSSIDEQEQIIL